MSKTANAVTMDDLLKNQPVTELSSGEVVEGKVISVKKNEVVIDLGAPGVGIVLRREIGYNNQDLKPGDEVSASVIDAEIYPGQALLSLRKAAKDRGWDELAEQSAAGEVVEIVPGGPADRDSRLKAGDRIVGVAQGDTPGEPVDVVDMRLRKVVRMIRGPKGTKVHLTVLESGNSTPSVIDIVRDKVELTGQKAHADVREVPVPAGADKTGRVAVINLPSFYCDFAAKRDGDENYRSCTRDVRQLIDEAALAAALQNGEIAGAGLDVLSQEPPSAKNPLLSAPNCIITPHIAWATRAARQRLVNEVVANLEAFLAGEKRNRVD